MLTLPSSFIRFRVDVGRRVCPVRRWKRRGVARSRTANRPNARCRQLLTIYLTKLPPVKAQQSSQDEITLGRAAAIEEFITFVDRSGLNFRRPDLMIECRQMIERFRRSDCPADARAPHEFTIEEDQPIASAELIDDAHSAAARIPRNETFTTPTGMTIAPKSPYCADRYPPLLSMSAAVPLVDSNVHESPYAK